MSALKIKHPRLTHPLTGRPLEAVGIVNGRVIWPIMGGDPSNDPPGGDDGDKGDPPGGNDDGDKPKEKPAPNGFPENTALAEMTVEQREAYWKHNARKHEEAEKAYKALGKTPDEIKALLDASKPDSEKALEAAREEGRAEARAEVNKTIADTLVASRLKSLDKKAEDFPALEALDLTKFTNDDGSLNTDKVTAVIDSIAPSTAGGGGNDRGPDKGLGKRGNAKQSAKAAGKSEAERRFGKKQQ